MKTLIATVLALFSLTASFAGTEGSESSTSSFGASVYTSTATGRLHVSIDKQQGTTVRILLVNEQGEAFYRQIVKKDQSSYRGRFVIDQLSDGRYKLLITDGSTTQSHLISLKTQAPVPAATQTITVQ